MAEACNSVHLTQLRTTLAFAARIGALQVDAYAARRLLARIRSAIASRRAKSLLLVSATGR